MIKQLLLCAGTVLLTAAFGCLADAEGPGVVAKPKLESVYLALGPVANDQVAAAVSTRVTQVPGVKSFTWIKPRAEAKVVRVVGKADTAKLVAACKAAGVAARALSVAHQRLTFQKKLHCNGCVIRVKRAIRAVKGTKDIQVSKDRTYVTIAYDTKVATVAQLRKAVASAGYPAVDAR